MGGVLGRPTFPYDHEFVSGGGPHPCQYGDPGMALQGLDRGWFGGMASGANHGVAGWSGYGPGRVNRQYPGGQIVNQSPDGPADVGGAPSPASGAPGPYIAQIQVNGFANGQKYQGVQRVRGNSSVNIHEVRVDTWDEGGAIYSTVTRQQYGQALTRARVTDKNGRQSVKVTTHNLPAWRANAFDGSWVRQARASGVPGPWPTPMDASMTSSMSHDKQGNPVVGRPSNQVLNQPAPPRRQMPPPGPQLVPVQAAAGPYAGQPGPAPINVALAGGPPQYAPMVYPQGPRQAPFGNQGGPYVVAPVGGGCVPRPVAR